MPVWRGAARPWHVGVLWDRDGALSKRLLAALQRDATLIVGDNDGANQRQAAHILQEQGVMAPGSGGEK